MNGWNISEKNMVLSKEFLTPISYVLPITDYAQNSSEVLINIQNATCILLQYGFFVPHNKHTLVSSGKVASFKATTSNSIYLKLSGHINSSLQGKSYIYNNSKNKSNLTSIYKWILSRLKNISDFSIAYQVHVKDIGWLKAVCDGQENMSQKNNIISAFRINLVPLTEKQYLIDFWNRDVGTIHIN